MAARNGTDGYGWVSRALHWTMALLLIAMLGLGTWIERMTPALSNLWLYGLHKSVGLSLLALVLMRVIWHRISPPPAPLTVAPWQARAARASHLTLYLLLVAIPLTGWAGSDATGIGVTLFGRWTLPTVFPVSEAWDSAAFVLHDVLTKVLMAVVVLHVAAALWHHWRPGDTTLRRMWRGDA